MDHRLVLSLLVLLSGCSRCGREPVSGTAPLRAAPDAASVVAEADAGPPALPEAVPTEEAADAGAESQPDASVASPGPSTLGALLRWKNPCAEEDPACMVGLPRLRGQ